MSFDDWWKAFSGEDRLPENSFINVAYKAGAQSRQAEIDELRKRLAMYEREGYKLVPVSFLKDINSVAVDEFHKWKIKEEQMPAICEYMQDLSFYIGVEK